MCLYIYCHRNAITINRCVEPIIINYSVLVTKTTEILLFLYNRILLPYNEFVQRPMFLNAVLRVQRSQMISEFEYIFVRETINFS